MKYIDFISNIINTRGQWSNDVLNSGICEKHHIIPKCFGGSNKKDNLIYLYAREHFIAHKLLAEENPDNYKLINAFWCMCTKNNKNKYFTADEYEHARLMFVNSISGENHRDVSGSNNPMWGRVGPNKGKKVWNSGRTGVYSEETLNKMRGPKSEEAKLNMRKPHKVSEKGRLTWGMTGKLPANAKSVKCIENNIIYSSISAAAKDLNLSATSIIKNASGIKDDVHGYHFIFIKGD